MKLAAVTSAVLLGSLALAPAAFAQATKAAAKPPPRNAVPPPRRPRRPPSPELSGRGCGRRSKGTAYIEVIKGNAKAVGGEIGHVTR